MYLQVRSDSSVRSHAGRLRCFSQLFLTRENPVWSERQSSRLTRGGCLRDARRSIFTRTSCDAKNGDAAYPWCRALEGHAVIKQVVGACADRCPRYSTKQTARVSACNAQATFQHITYGANRRRIGVTLRRWDARLTSANPLGFRRAPGCSFDPLAPR